MKKKYAFWLLMATVIVYSCRKPYNPPAIASPPSILVVEGVITGSKLGIARGLNQLWNKGGIQYAPPIR